MIIAPESDDSGAIIVGATSGTRTHDLLVTNEILYQLSYSGRFCGCKVNIFFSFSQENFKKRTRAHDFRAPS